jgi:hypothetical protein
MATTRGTVVPGRIRRRITTVVSVVETCLVGGASVPVPPPSSGPVPVARVDEPAARWPSPAPLRRGRVDRPAALSHYQAMAAQLARECRMQPTAGRARRG